MFAVFIDHSSSLRAWTIKDSPVLSGYATKACIKIKNYKQPLARAYYLPQKH